MKTIRSYRNVAEAGFAQSLLQAAGIDAFIPHEFAATSSPEFAIWRIRVQVPDEDVERAVEILDGQAGLNPESPGASLDESPPVQHEVEPPAGNENASVDITCPNCGVEWELTRDEAGKDEFTCQECNSTFPIEPDFEHSAFRPVRVVQVFVLVSVILLVAGIGYHIVGGLFSHDPNAYYRRGISRQHNGDLDGALADFNSAIELSSRFAAAYCSRGIVKWAKGDPDGAMADFEQAIAIEPEEPETYYDRAVVKRYKGDLSGAIADCSRAIALNRNKPEFHWARGNAEHEQGDLDRAMADYNQAIAIDPLMAEPYYYRSSVKVSEGDLDGAMADVKKAIALDPLKPEPYYYRGYVERAEGDFDGAMADFNQAIALNPKKPYAYLARGFVKGVMGDVDGAIADDNKAIALDPKYASAYDERGNTNAVMRKWAAALADYRQCCDLSLAHQDYPRLYSYLIRARLGEREAARKELSAYIANRKNPASDSGIWVATIAGYLIGSVNEAVFFAAAGSSNENRSQRQTCEAWYYAGMEKLLGGDKKNAAVYLQKCIGTKEKDCVEYGFAQSELNALGK